MNVCSIVKQQCSETSLSVAFVCMFVNLWHWVNGPVLVSTVAVRAPQCTGPESGTNTNHSISVCMCVRTGICVLGHICACVLQCPPLNSEGGFTYTPMHAHSHTHSLALALLSPWVVCAANVYDLNQANPTGLFQWIENDLQDAETGPRREEEIRGNLRASFQFTLWLDLHTLLLFACLSPSGSFSEL